LPPALLSRFDLLFLLLDKNDYDQDEALAYHVASVHKHTGIQVNSEQDKDTIPVEVMRAFISHAQTFDPVIPYLLHNYIVGKYVEKRKIQRDGINTDSSYLYVTPRTLLGFIRLAQAMAKLNFRSEVQQ